MSRAFRNFMFVLLGIIVAIGIFCAVVGIASLVNGISFIDQIVQWFGVVQDSVEESSIASLVKNSLIMG